MGKQEINVYGLEIRTTYLIFGEDENKVMHTTLVISRRKVDSGPTDYLKKQGDQNREGQGNLGRDGESSVLGRGRECYGVKDGVNGGSEGKKLLE